MKFLALLPVLLLLTGCVTTGSNNHSLVPAKSKLQLVWGEGVFTEGPAVDRDGSILFTDLRRNLILRYHPLTGNVNTYREASGSANGLAFDAAGNLLACEGADGGNRRISITDRSGKTATLVDNYEGKKFNSPNDIAVAPNGDIYFTDPRYRGPETVELDFEGVFLVRDGKAILATRATERPNGILVSLDGKQVFVADNNNQDGGARTLCRFDAREDGVLINKSVLFSFSDHQRGIDGMAMDADGNIYATAGSGEDAGVYIFSPTGSLREKIKVPDFPTNCTFKGKWLYITAMVKALPDGSRQFGLYRIKLNRRGR